MGRREANLFQVWKKTKAFAESFRYNHFNGFIVVGATCKGDDGEEGKVESPDEFAFLWVLWDLGQELKGGVSKLAEKQE
jgi:hypothetical protein